MAHGFNPHACEYAMENRQPELFAMSIQSVASPAAAFINPPKPAALAHIPGDEGWPVIGRTLAVLADPKGEVERMSARYGLIYRNRILGETSITMLGPGANA